jgi:hypothetical protein
VYRSHVHGMTVSESTMRSFCRKHGVRPYPPTSRDLKANPAHQAAAHRPCRILTKAAVGALVLLSQEAARCSMIPTLRTTLGLKGHRPIVGSWDGHDAIDVFGALHVVTGHLCTRIVERQRSSSRQRSLPAAFARPCGTWHAPILRPVLRVRSW